MKYIKGKDNVVADALSWWGEEEIYGDVMWYNAWNTMQWKAMEYNTMQCNIKVCNLMYSLTWAFDEIACLGIYKYVTCKF